MPQRRCRSFTAEFKAQVVLEVRSGLKSQSEVARQHKSQKKPRPASLGAGPKREIALTLAAEYPVVRVMGWATD